MPPKPNLAPAEIALTPDGRLKLIPNGGGDFPAVELIDRFLKLIATATGVPRDAHTVNQVFSRTNLVYEGLLTLIRSIDGASVTDLDALSASFNVYITAIPQLERFLFEFFQGYIHKKFRGHLPPTDSTANGVIYVQTWKSDRDLLTKSLESLKHDAFRGLSTQLANQLIAGYTQERHKDDQNLLNELSQFIHVNKVGDEHIDKSTKVAFTIKAMKGELAGIANKALQSPYNESSMSIIIRMFMYFAIPCTLILSEDVDGQWKIYLRKVVIWEAFNSLILKVKDYLSAPKNATEIETQFSEIEKLLLKLGDTEIATAAEMLNLFKLAPGIYRQYHGRSAALIKTLYYLDAHSRKPEQKAFASYRYDLKQVMTECVENLTILMQTKLDIANFSTESAEYKAKAKEIEGLFNRTKPLFNSLGADGSQLTRYEDTYTKAVSIDETHVREAKEKLFPVSA